jgi:hypothetical protein
MALLKFLQLLSRTVIIYNRQFYVAHAFPTCASGTHPLYGPGT